MIERLRFLKAIVMTGKAGFTEDVLRDSVSPSTSLTAFMVVRILFGIMSQH